MANRLIITIASHDSRLTRAIEQIVPTAENEYESRRVFSILTN